jgi:hypothetical protein
MGLILGAQCKCGFNQQFDFGSNLIDFHENCFVPAICLNCNKFQVINYLDNDSCCIDCGSEITPYNDPSLQLNPEMNGNKFAISWLVNADKGRFILPPTQYKCPKCGNMKLHFVNCGCWDGRSKP